jgi:THO complex subunit 3
MIVDDGQELSTSINPIIVQTNSEKNYFKEAFNKSVKSELFGHKKRVYSLDWNISGSKLSSGSVDNSIRIWSVELGSSTEIKGHQDSVTHLKFSSIDENLLISCSSDKTVKLWDIRTGKSMKSEKCKGGCKNIQFNSDSSIFSFSNKDDDMISFYDLRKFSFIKSLEFKTKISEFEFDKSDEIFIVATSSGCLRLYDSKKLEEEPLVEIEGHYPSVTCINISKDNLKLATGASDALICLWDMEEFISYKVLKKGENPLRKVLFSHDSKLIASIYEGNNLDIFETSSGDLVHSLGNDNQQYSIAWSPNNYVLAYCGDEKNRNNSDEGNIRLISLI